MSDVTHGSTQIVSTLGALGTTTTRGGHRTSADAAPRSVALALKDIVQLTKPRITAMALIVAAGAVLLAPGTIHVVDAMLVLVGIGMAVGGAGALNMFVERDVDLLMERTRGRPLASGRLGATWGLLIGSALGFGSLPLLYVVGGPLTCALTAFSLFAYVLVYTPMKRTSPWALPVGAVPGAMPALMGSTAVTDRFDASGLALFAFVLLWQLPHFLAIAIYREREYVAAGHRIVPAVWGMTAAKAIMLGTAVALAASGVALWPLGVGGALTGVAAILLGGWFVSLSARGLLAPPRGREHDDAWARGVFHASLVYQTALFAALAVDRIFVGAGAVVSITGLGA